MSNNDNIANAQPDSKIIYMLNGMVSEPNKDEIILEEFSHNGNLYYKDSTGNILNDESELVGTLNANGKVIWFQTNAPIEIDKNIHNFLE
jgi:hypothetical protein